MRLVTGDECGLLKECIPELSRRNKKNDDIVASYNNTRSTITKDGVERIDATEKQTRERGVIDMVWLDTNHHKTDNGDNNNYSFAALRKNGTIEIWNAQADNKKSFGQYRLLQTTKNIFGDKHPRPLGLGYFKQRNRICAGDMLGNITVINSANLDKSDIITSYNPYTTSKRGKTISYTPGSVLNTQLATSIAFDSVHGRVAVGGRERETSIIDISTGELVFKGKNLPPDPQTLLQQPVWPTAIQFLNNFSNTMAVGTAYRGVRLYDVRENSKIRRPTLTTPEGLLEYRVTSLCQIDDHELVVGDTAGYIYSLDLRRLGKDRKSPANHDLGRYVGPAGSVRQMKKHPTLSRLAVVGLDRMLRVYDCNKRKQLDCIYLKQRLNCVLFHPDEIWDPFDGTNNDNATNFDAEDGDIDQDDVVEDYINSDEDDQSDESDSDIEGEQPVSEDDEVGEEENEIFNEDDSQSDEESDASLGESSIEEERSDDRNKDEDEEEEDEVIVVKARKKQRFL